MWDSMSLYLLTRVRHEELIREAAADRLTDLAITQGVPLRVAHMPGFGQIARAWALSIIARVRLGPPLESTRG